MDTINFEILEDGTITIKTSEISDGNHLSADELLAQMEELLGGQVIKKENPEKHRHIHTCKEAHIR